jgi:hypothetical protein
MSQDLTPLMDIGEELGALLGAKCVAALGITPAQAQSYGKAAIVGEAGELEHAAAILHPKLGAPLRKAVEKGAALVPSSKKQGGWAQAALDVPLGHKDAAYVRSHFDGIEVRVADAPRANEIMVAVAVTDSGRPLPRVGGLTGSFCGLVACRFSGRSVRLDQLVQQGQQAGAVIGRQGGKDALGYQVAMRAQGFGQVATLGRQDDHAEPLVDLVHRHIDQPTRCKTFQHAVQRRHVHRGLLCQLGLGHAGLFPQRRQHGELAGGHPLGPDLGSQHFGKELDRDLVCDPQAIADL